MKKSILCAAVMLAAAAFIATVGPTQTVFAQQGKGKGGGKQAPATLLPTAVVPRSDDGQIHVMKVQGNVYMLVGAPAGNIALQVGDSGVLLVDTMTADVSDKVVAAIRTISDKPIRYIINTTVDADHTGGNANVAKLGAPVVGGNLGNANRGAAIIASENLANRMSSQTPPPPNGASPTVTYFEGQKELFFNNEGIEVMLAPKAHTDGESIVYFRRSDVVVAGDIFLTTTFPVINIEAGGNVNGVIAGLNHVLDIAIPEHEQEGGTYIIPGHGRLCDEHDVLEYRDMVTIVRDRVQNMIKKGMTMAQVKAAKPTLEYDGRYGTTSGPGSTDSFVEAVYKSLEKK
jgi:cyclase